MEAVMLINESHFDRIIRAVTGLTLVMAAATGFIGPWGWIGLLPLITGLVGFCPAYRLFGLSSCPIPKTD
jgi:hypothetical protein